MPGTVAILGHTEWGKVGPTSQALSGAEGQVLRPEEGGGLWIVLRGVGPWEKEALAMALQGCQLGGQARAEPTSGVTPRPDCGIGAGQEATRNAGKWVDGARQVLEDSCLPLGPASAPGVLAGHSGEAHNNSVSEGLSSSFYR